MKAIKTGLGKIIYDVAVAVAIGAAFSGFLCCPGETTEAIQKALALCANVLIPSLFPCFVLSSMAVECGLAEYAGKAFRHIMRPLFNVPGECAPALALGLISGYPVGARTAIAIYKKGLCSKAEAERLLSFCNNAGPAFILGTIGFAIFEDGRVGMTLYLAHLISSIAVGLIFRFYKRGDGKHPEVSRRVPEPSLSAPLALVSGVKSGAAAMLNITAFVVFFAAAVRVLFVTGLIPAVADLMAAALPIQAADAESVITGIIEMSSGLWSLSGSGAELSVSISMAAFMLGWAGVSVHCQVLSFVGEAKLSMLPYIVGKLLHSVMSAAAAWIMSGIFFNGEPVVAAWSGIIARVASMDFIGAFGIAAASSGLVWAGLLAVAALKNRICTGKKRGNGI